MHQRCVGQNLHFFAMKNGLWEYLYALIPDQTLLMIELTSRLVMRALRCNSFTCDS